MTTSYCYIQKTKFNNQGINWFDDNQLKREDRQAIYSINLGTDVDQLIDKIEELTWCNGVVDWHITEDFAISGERDYYLQGLTMELEDGIVVCSDINDELIKDISRVLNMCLTDSIVNVEFHAKNVIKVLFKDGSIIIRGLN